MEANIVENILSGNSCSCGDPGSPLRVAEAEVSDEMGAALTQVAEFTEVINAFYNGLDLTTGRDDTQVFLSEVQLELDITKSFADAYISSRLYS